jgi:hypothetical protein
MRPFFKNPVHQTSGPADILPEEWGFFYSDKELCRVREDYRFLKRRVFPGCPE